MNAQAILSLVGLIGVITGPLIAWRVATRSSSGSIKPTEAATLWAESDQMRKEYRAETLALRQEAVAQRLAAQQSHDEITALRKTHDECEARCRAMKEELDLANAQVASLKIQLKGKL